MEFVGTRMLLYHMRCARLLVCCHHAVPQAESKQVTMEMSSQCHSPIQCPHPLRPGLLQIQISFKLLSSSVH